MTDPTTDLPALLLRVAERDALRVRREQVRAELAAARARFRDARTRLRAASEAAARSAGFSLAGWIASVRGGAQDARARAAAESTAARREHDGALESLAALEAEASGLDARLAPLADVDEQAEAAVAARETDLIAAGGASGARAAELAEGVHRARAARDLVREGAEAAGIGSAALDEVAKGLAQLEARARRHDPDQPGYRGMTDMEVTRVRTTAARACGRAERLRARMVEASAALGEDEMGEALGESRPLLDTVAGSMQAWMSPAALLEDGARVVRAGLAPLSAAMAQVQRARRDAGRLQVQLRTDLEAHTARAAAAERERRGFVVDGAPDG